VKFAEKYKVPVVGLGFVEALTDVNYNLVEEVKKHLISSWDIDVSAWLKSVNKKFVERGQEKKESSKFFVFYNFILS